MNAIKKRRAGFAVNAGDRSEGAFYCPVQGGGGGAEFSGPASRDRGERKCVSVAGDETASRTRRVLDGRDAPRDGLRQLRARFRGAFHAWLQAPRPADYGESSLALLPREDQEDKPAGFGLGSEAI